MILKDRSNRPHDLVVKLVDFALQDLDFDHNKLVTEIKAKTSGALSGRAWSGLSYSSPYWRTHKWRILVNVGKDQYFPATNLFTKTKNTFLTPWRDYPTGVRFPRWGDPTPFGGKVGSVISFHLRPCPSSGRDQIRWYKTETVKVPYGGKKSPAIQYNDWMEALVAVAAHEGMHIVQFTKKLICRESDCEIASLKALTRYRNLFS